MSLALLPAQPTGRPGASPPSSRSTPTDYLGRAIGVHFDPRSSLVGSRPGGLWGRPLGSGVRVLPDHAPARRGRGGGGGGVMDREGSHVLAGLVLQRLGAGDGGSVWFERDAMGQVALWRERPCARGHGGGPASWAGGRGARLTPQPLPWLSLPPSPSLRAEESPWALRLGRPGQTPSSPLRGTRGSAASCSGHWRVKGGEGSRWEKQPMARSSWDGMGGGGGSRAEGGRGRPPCAAPPGARQGAAWGVSVRTRPGTLARHRAWRQRLARRPPAWPWRPVRASSPC